jgi:hypothetical protein
MYGKDFLRTGQKSEGRPENLTLSERLLPAAKPKRTLGRSVFANQPIEGVTLYLLPFPGKPIEEVTLYLLPFPGAPGLL